MSRDNLKEFTVKYGGDQQEINANTLIHSLIDITTIIQEVNRELGTGTPLDIKIKALKPGSFLVDIHLLGFYEAIRGLLTADNFKTTSELIGAVVSLVKLRQLFKKEEPPKSPQTGGTVTIESSNGNTISIDNRVYNLYLNNSTVQNALNNNFETLKEDPNISDFEILDDKDNPLVVIEREEFSKMAAAPLRPISEEAIEPLDRPRTITERAMLYIVRPSFDKKLKWDFVYKDIKIPATLADDEFIERVRRGQEGFFAGDILDVDLQINRKIEESAQVPVNKSYRIVKVYRHIKRSEQMNLFPKESSQEQLRASRIYRELGPANDKE